MKQHLVAIVGGACAGSEAALQMVSKGVEVVVFEQNALPYGKIEDGLPRWHEKLQLKEREKIDQKLSMDKVHFIPNCAIGKKVQWQDLLNWGFSAIILANGAWRDRPLNIEGREEVQDNSFCYQNPFIYWFNHYHEKSYQGEHYPVSPGAVVIGGGLASIDVVKVCQLENIKNRLQEMGKEVDVLEMERKGIAATLSQLGLSYENLQLAPATLYYRKRIKDMPLTPLSPEENPQKAEKIYQVREKVIKNACQKYLFQVEPLSVPKRIHQENGSVVGVTFVRSVFDGKNFALTPEEKYVPTSFVVSSIGSIPAPIPGIAMKGEVYDILDEVTGSLREKPGIYGVGNVVTGRGNIQVSYRHAKFLSEFLAESLLENQMQAEALWEKQQSATHERLKSVFQHLSKQPGLSEEKKQSILNQVHTLQKNEGYQDYPSWREKILAQRQ